MALTGESDQKKLTPAELSRMYRESLTECARIDFKALVGREARETVSTPYDATTLAVLFVGRLLADTLEEHLSR